VRWDSGCKSVDATTADTLTASFGLRLGSRSWHGAQLTMGTYGHVIDELEDAPQLPAEDAIRQARERVFGGSRTRLVPAAG